MAQPLGSIETLTMTMKATGTVTAGRFVTFAGAQATADQRVYGVARADTNANDVMSVQVLGYAEMEAPEVLAAGTTVYSDADGKPTASGTSHPAGIVSKPADSIGKIVGIVLLPMTPGADHSRIATSVTAGAGGVTAGQFVALDNTAAGADVAVLGVALNDAAVSEAVSVATHGIVDMTSPEDGLTAGTDVYSNASGAPTASGSSNVAGVCLDAGDTGDTVRIMLR